MTTSATAIPSSLLPQPTQVDCLCLGSGRFLRSVLVPAINAANYKSVIVQPRGRTFLDHSLERDGSNASTAYEAGDAGDGGDAKAPLNYEVDVVGYGGQVVTETVGCWGAGTLGTEEGVAEVLDLLDQMTTISIIGVGVTEAGLSSPQSPSLLHLATILSKVSELMFQGKLTCPNPNGKICIINTDNVPGNGSVIRQHLLYIASKLRSCCNASSNLGTFLENTVAIHDTMVDRITSQRDGSNGLVPRCEPVPSKALVIEDLNGDLPPIFASAELKSKYGVVVRTKTGQLNGDIALKLRVANGTHTAVAHVMALSSLLMTDVLAQTETNDKAAVLMKYLDSYFADQVLVAAQGQFGKEECQAVYDDWRRRLCHPKFGLSTFFITQNGAAKGGIRIGPTIQDLISKDESVAATTSFAIAAILRFLTPAQPTSAPSSGVYRGWLDGCYRNLAASADGSTGETITYADGLRYNLEEGWYEFRGSCDVAIDPGTDARPICEVLGSFGDEAKQPNAYVAAVIAYLTKSDGGNLADIMTNPTTASKVQAFGMSVATLYARMVAGDGMLSILNEICGGD